MAKVISVDNFDREGPGSDEYLIKDGLTDEEARAVADDWNAKYSGDHAPRFARVVKDSHVLWKYEP